MKIAKENSQLSSGVLFCYGKYNVSTYRGEKARKKTGKNEGKSGKFAEMGGSIQNRALTIALRHIVPRLIVKGGIVVGKLFVDPRGVDVQ